MSEPRELHAYDYVALTYQRVRDAMRADAVGIFQRATQIAAKRAQDLAAHLTINLGVLEIGTDVNIDVKGIREEELPQGERTTKIDLAWRGARAASFFPSMDAVFSIYPLSSTETQLDIHGRYRPPLGVVGTALDALIGHRIAEASVLRFVQDVRVRLETELGHSR